MPSIHARLSPSAAHRWVTCPSSLGLEEQHVKRYGIATSSFAEEGTAAHELAEKALVAECAPYKFQDMDAENQWSFTEEMCGFVDEYVKRVREYAEGHTLLIEQQVDFSDVVGVPDSFGTGDAIILTADGLELQLHDLKYGMGVQVDAEDNEQLMTYALGALHKFNLLGAIEQVRMVIHQPRKRHFSEHVISVKELNIFGEKLRRQGQYAIFLADEGEEGDIMGGFSPSEKACKFCKVKATCPARLEEVRELMSDKFEDLSLEDAKAEVTEKVREVPTVGTEHLARIYPRLKLMDSYIKAVWEHLNDAIRKGDTVEGFKLVQGKSGNRVWEDPEMAEEIMKSMRMKHEEMYAKTLISPTAAQKVLKENPKKWTRLQEQIIQPKGALVMVPADDKRQAVNVTASDDMFEDMTGSDLV